MEKIEKPLSSLPFCEDGPSGSPASSTPKRSPLSWLGMSPGFLLRAQGLRPQHLPGLAAGGAGVFFSWDPTSPPGAVSRTEMSLVAQVMKWKPQSQEQGPGPGTRSP